VGGRESYGAAQHPMGGVDPRRSVVRTAIVVRRV
jgi:hypothetical protein